MPVRVMSSPMSDDQGEVTGGDGEPIATCRPNVFAVNAPSATPSTVRPASAAAPPPAPSRRTAATMPAIRPRRPRCRIPDDERPDPRVDRGPEHLADALRRPGSGGSDRGASPTTTATASSASRAPPTRRPLMPMRQHPRRRDGRNNRTPWRTPHPIDPSNHSPRNSDAADDEEEDREDDEDDRECRERRDTPDLAGDRAGLGLGEVDVRYDEALRGIARPRRSGRACRAAAYAARAGRRGGSSEAAWSRGGGVEGSGLAFGSSRGVLRVGSARGRLR